MTSVASPRVVNIEDLRLLARRRLPKVVFDYLDGGAEGEVTLRENRRAFDAVTFRPHHAVSVSGVDLRTAVLGSELAFPLLLAPVGYSRLMHPAGERAAAGAAGAAGAAYILSTMSGHKLEEVKAASSGPVWYQLYLIGGRDAAEAAIARARAAGYAALVVTIDTPVPGPRVLPEVVTAVGGQAEVLMDGGIRRGSDIVKAICLGARAGLVGRAYAYGLAAAGEAGVTRALDILRADMERTLKLLGCATISQLDRSFVDTTA